MWTALLFVYTQRWSVRPVVYCIVLTFNRDWSCWNIFLFWLVFVIFRAHFQLVCCCWLVFWLCFSGYLDFFLKEDPGSNGVLMELIKFLIQWSKFLVEIIDFECKLRLGLISDLVGEMDSLNTWEYWTVSRSRCIEDIRENFIFWLLIALEIVEQYLVIENTFF